MGQWVKKELTVLVKTYPNLSKRYNETVCVAGIDSAGQWFRIYPIPFRDLDSYQKFTKYQQITVDIQESRQDPRPESRKANFETLNVGRKYESTGRDLNERKLIVDKGIVGSMCQMLELQKQERRSLGAIRPHEVLDFEVQLLESDAQWDNQLIEQATQNNLFNQEKSPLEAPKYRFKYRYRCADKSCNTHSQSIIDWEIHQSYREWTRKRGEERALEMIKEKWLDQICDVRRDTTFFVGNHNKNPQGFMVLGTFWPPKGAIQPQLL